MRFLFFINVFILLSSSCDIQTSKDEKNIISGPESKNLVVVSLIIAEGEEQNVFDVLDSDMGLPYTRNYDGCLGLEKIYNEATRTVWIVSNWESYEKYAVYLKWRQEVDTTLAGMIPMFDGGEEGFSVWFPNVGYKSY